MSLAPWQAGDVAHAAGCDSVSLPAWRFGLSAASPEDASWRGLGVAIVGPRGVAGQHIKSFVENPPTEVRALVGILSEDRPRAEADMTKYGFRCESTDDHESVLGRRDIDIVSVCTINSLHFEPGLAALEAGKHTLIEKPLCLTLDELRRLCAAGKAEAAAR